MILLALMWFVPFSSEKTLDLRPSVDFFERIIVVKDAGIAALSAGHYFNSYTSAFCPWIVIKVVAANDGQGVYRVSKLRFRLLRADDSWINPKEPP